MDEFLGNKYTLVSSENFEEYLAFMDVGFAKRKIVMSLKPSQRLISNNDGTYTIQFTSAVTNKSVTFTPDIEFEDERLDGMKVKSTISFNGNKMFQVQVGSNGVKSTSIYEFLPDKLIMSVTAVGFDKTVKREYKLDK